MWYKPSLCWIFVILWNMIDWNLCTELFVSNCFSQSKFLHSMVISILSTRTVQESGVEIPSFTPTMEVWKLIPSLDQLNSRNCLKNMQETLKKGSWISWIKQTVVILFYIIHHYIVIVFSIVYILQGFKIINMAFETVQKKAYKSSQNPQ